MLQTKEQSPMFRTKPNAHIFKKYLIKLPRHLRDVQRMEKVKVIQEECTLHWAIPPLRPLKQRVKSFLKNLCRIYTALVDQCNVIS